MVDNWGAVFSGHVNHHTVDYVSQTLPRTLKERLGAALRDSGNRQIPPDRISQILRDSVVQLDDSISSNFLDFFPRDLRRLGRMSDREVQNVFQRDTTGRSRSAAARCLGGTTLVLRYKHILQSSENLNKHHFLSLTDPDEKNVWVANLGGKVATYPFEKPWDNNS